MSYAPPKPKRDDTTRAATQVANPILEQNALDRKASQMSAKNASIEQQTQAFGGKSNEIVTLIVDEAGSKSKGGNEQIIKVEVKPDVQVQAYNEISSFSVDKLNCAETVSKLSSIFSAYSKEIDFGVNEQTNTIEDGCVFINNYYSVHFMVFVERDEANKVTRFEFRRQSGDALASAKFLGDIKAQFFGKSDDEKEDKSLIGLELNADDMDMKVSDENKEMMMIHEALIADDFVGNDLDENAENYLYGQLVKSGAVNKQKDAVDAKVTCATLITKNVLLHDDVAVVRAALLILKKMANDKDDFGLAGNEDLFALLSQVMLKQDGLVQQYAVLLMSALAQSEKEWKMNDKVKVDLNKSLKEYQTLFSNKKYFDEKLVDTVMKKL